MFDSYSVTQRRSYPDVVNITEKRAPTDDSIRLAHEMENKLKNELVSITRLDNNIFKCTWHVFYSPCRFSGQAVCRFKLNDLEYKFEMDLWTYGQDPASAAKDIYDRVLKEISQVITIELFKQHGKEMLPGYPGL